MTEKREFDGDIPGIAVAGNSIPEAWENSLLSVYKSGLRYSRDGPKDKGRMQVDSTMMTTIKHHTDSPLFFHKFLSTVPPQNLLAYHFEFLGAKDCLAVEPRFDPEGDTRWEYTYHRGFERYNEEFGRPVDQIAAVINKLATEPHKRNSQMITWRPEIDLHEDNPACMQRAWFFPVPMPDGSFRLNGNYSFRSRNPMTAAPMNWSGESVFLSWLAEQVQDEMQKSPEQQALAPEKRVQVVPGRIIDISDSYHVSARDQHLLQKFIENYNASIQRGDTIEQRAMPRSQWYMMFQDMLETREVRDMIYAEINSRYDERVNLHPELNGEVNNERDKELARLDGIEKWLVKHYSK